MKDLSENKFWLRTWQTLGATVVTVVALALTYSFLYGETDQATCLKHGGSSIHGECVHLRCTP